MHASVIAAYIISFITYSFIELPRHISIASISSHRKTGNSLVQRFFWEFPFIFPLTGKAQIQQV